MSLIYPWIYQFARLNVPLVNIQTCKFSNNIAYLQMIWGEIPDFVVQKLLKKVAIFVGFLIFVSSDLLHLSSSQFVATTCATGFISPSFRSVGSELSWFRSS